MNKNLKKKKVENGVCPGWEPAFSIMNSDLWKNTELTFAYLFQRNFESNETSPRHPLSNWKIVFPPINTFFVSQILC